MSSHHDHSHDHSHDHPHPQEHGPFADASVRLARASDVPAVGLVQAVVWRDAYAGALAPEVLEQFEPRSFAAVWRQSLSAPPTPDHLLLVACAGEQVVGLAALGPAEDPDSDAGTTAELLVIAVHPDVRRQGHGSRLLNAVVDTARGRGRVALSTWVLATDEGTRAFLQEAGMEPDGAHRTRVVSPDGDTLAEVRLSASVSSGSE